MAAAVAEAREKVLERPSASSWGRLGMVLAAHDLVAEAVICYRRAAELAPGEDRWPYLAGRALRATDFDAALAEFAKAATLRSRLPAVWVQYGDALLEAGDGTAARRQFARALELEPENPWALFGLARAAFLVGEVETTRGHLERAVAAKPNYREGHSLLAQVAQRFGDGEAAELHMWAASNHPQASGSERPVLRPGGGARRELAVGGAARQGPRRRAPLCRGRGGVPPGTGGGAGRGPQLGQPRRRPRRPEPLERSSFGLRSRSTPRKSAPSATWPRP